MKTILTLASKKKDILLVVITIAAFAALVAITAIAMHNHPSVLN